MGLLVLVRKIKYLLNENMKLDFQTDMVLNIN